jgi:hypothetical protein
VGDLPVLLASGQERVPADVAACHGLPLEHENLVAARGGDARVLQASRAAADHQHPLRLGDRLQRAVSPLPLTPDLRVVDALHAAAADHAAPAVVGRHAAADVLLASVAGFHRPVGVGEELAREQDRVGIVGGQDLLCDPGFVIRPTRRTGFVETSLTAFV